MSAYVVNPDHLRLLVQAASHRGPLPSSEEPLTWYAEHPNTIWRRLSGSPHEERSQAIAAARREVNDFDPDTQARTMRMLHEQNVKSVRCRYPDCEDEGEPLPGTEVDWQGWAPTYEPVARTLAPVVVLKAIACYEYQACEDTDGWETSEAKAFCDALRGKMIRKLPGYGDAPGWDFQRAEKAA